ncbi:HET domain-containing protein [Colletotrichum truncatum]|uniref:HET domain-containing protein n=1 Tax=Colletotrichum truncatum TaxID=5467 RepID=A0ACC3Z1Y0_COLTU|nr:HET domain-containing protein [Colletotrichum truncatum]KAF6781385.1 HET domain-containing protein [Colletotrichum truncatum]
MKLLNCMSLEIEEFFGSFIPEKYAILSHMWEDGEASFQDFGNIKAKATKPGWAKIKQTCSLARQQGFSYVWIDTCCIDKTNSAELTEAINSMFNWYARSTVCYAFLSDISAKDEKRDLRESRWFTRGWTLQELIAPPRVLFYDKDWRAIGTRQGLSEVISKRTGISKTILEHSETDKYEIEDLLSEVLVAHRMSWAAGRTTTREEDLAYCLLGIFNVNMPLLYGEGSKAFTRLQEEIIKESDDLSLFAWGCTEPKPQDQSSEQVYFGILARSPDDFANEGSLEEHFGGSTVDAEYSMTNKGLRIKAPLEKVDGFEGRFLFLGFTAHDILDIGIWLKDQGQGRYVRVLPPKEAFKSLEFKKTSPDDETDTCFIQKHLADRQSWILETCHRSFSFPFKDLFSSIPYASHQHLTYRVVKSFPPRNWMRMTEEFRTEGLRSFEGFVIVHISGPVICDIVIALGFTSSYSLDRPWMSVGTLKSHPELFKAAIAHNLEKVKSLGRSSENRTLVLEQAGGRNVEAEFSLRSEWAKKSQTHRVSVNWSLIENSR